MSGSTAFTRLARLTASALTIAALFPMVASVALKSGSSDSSIASFVNLAGLLSARSPGSRTQAKVTKSNQVDRGRDAPAESSGEAERVLVRVFPSSTDDHLVATPEELLAGIYPFDQEIAFPDGEIEQLAGASRVMSEFAGVQGTGGGYSSGGGSGREGPGGPAIAPVQRPSVPEPSTWALMLMGAAMCGASMRRRKSMPFETREA